MAVRTVVAGILGGLALLVWSMVSHAVIGLAETGVRQLPNEQLVLVTLRNNIPESGYYRFPAMKTPEGKSADEKKAAMQTFQQLFATGPVGTLLYRVKGGEFSFPKLVLTEYITNIVQALLLALLLLMSGQTTYFARARFAALAGLLAAITTNVTYWNWYSFPAAYTAAFILHLLIGYLLAGLVIAGIVRGAEHAASAHAA